MNSHHDLNTLRQRTQDLVGFIENAPGGTTRMQCTADWLNPDVAKRGGSLRMKAPEVPELRNISHVLTAYVNILKHAERPFTVGVFGQFNSGKSTLVNSLLGKVEGRFCQDVSNVPTQNRLHLIHCQKHEDAIIPFQTLGNARDAEKCIQDTPFESQFLLTEGILIVDTPGTGALGDDGRGVSVEDLRVMTSQFMPLCDFLLICMNVSALGNEGDRAAIELVMNEIPEIPSLIVVTQLDSKGDDYLDWHNASGAATLKDSFSSMRDDLVKRLGRFGREHHADSWGSEEQIRSKIHPVAIPKDGRASFGVEELRGKLYFTR